MCGGEFDVCLIDNDDRLTGALLEDVGDYRCRHKCSGRVVRRAQHDELGRRVAGIENACRVRTKIFVRICLDFSQFRALYDCVVLVHRKRRCRRDHVVPARLAEYAHQEVDRFARAPGHEQVGVGAPVVVGQQLPQAAGADLGVTVQRTPEPVPVVAPCRLIGVESNRVVYLGGGLVGSQAPDRFAGEGSNAHAPDSRRRVTAAACASRPSRPASVVTAPPRAARPSLVSSWTVMWRMNWSTAKPL